MSGSGGYYKYRCKYWLTYNCPKWVWINNAPCAHCLADGVDEPGFIGQPLRARPKAVEQEAAAQNNDAHKDGAKSIGEAGLELAVPIREGSCLASEIPECLARFSASADQAKKVVQQTGLNLKGKVEKVTASVAQGVCKEGAVGQKAVVLWKPSVDSEVKVNQIAIGEVINQEGVVLRELSIGSKAVVKQLAIRGVGEQKGVVHSEPSVGSKAEVKQIAIGGVVSKDYVSQYE